MNNVIAPHKRSIGEIIRHLVQEIQTGWHRRDHAVVAQPANQPAKVSTGRAVAESTSLRLVVERLRSGQSVAIFQIVGILNTAQGAALTSRVQELYEDGTYQVILDLSQVPAISSGGVFALRNLVRLLSRQPLLDPAVGWDALHAMADGNDTIPVQNLKLFYPQSAVRQSLVEVGLLDWVEVYTDLSQAIQALAQPTSR